MFDQRARKLLQPAAILVLITLCVTVAASAPAEATKNATGSAATSSNLAGRPTHLTAAALAAHLGADAPSGWAPVDGPTARIYFPADWAVETPSACVGTTSGIVSIGRLANKACGPDLLYAYPDDGAAILPGPTRVAGTPAKTIHGFAVYGPDTTSQPGWTIYEVPALATQLALRGTYTDQILSTIALPASTVAIDTAASMTPTAVARNAKTGKVETFHSTYRITVPTTWQVVEPNTGLCVWPYGGGPPQLIKLNSGLSAPSCPGLPLAAQFSLADGAVMYWPGATAADTNGGLTVDRQPLVTLHPGSLVVRAYAVDATTGLLLVRVGRTHPRIVSLALGPDGRVAGRVLAAIVPNR